MSKKILSAGVVLALVAAVLVGVGAQTTLAQMSLCQTVDALVLAGVIAPEKVVAAKAAAGCGATASAVSSFTRNLTVGSTGADVTALQTLLGVAPATGYFGAITKAAVMAYQTANGLPSTGYVGPMTLAKLNASAPVAPTTPATGCPAGMTCTPVAAACPAGYTCTPAGSVSTTGSEGSITVTQSNSGLASSVYEGDSKVGVFGLKIEAKNSDVSVQRIKLDLGDSARIYNKVLNKIYVMDGSTVLASSDLNSDTVVKESDNSYTITLTGMNLVVAKDASKTLKIAVDVKDTIDSAYRSGGTSPTNTISLFDTIRGVRAVDGAGIDQYGGFATSRNFSISSSLVDAATLKVSLNSSSPKISTKVASEGVNKDEADKITVLSFNILASKSNMIVTDITATSTGAAMNYSNITTAYLYDGPTEIDSASISSTTPAAVFSNLSIDVAKDTTKVLIIKVDVRNATTTARDVTTVVAVNGVEGENTVGDVFTSTGSATGEAVSFVSSGPIVTLVSKPTITRVRESDTNNANSTTTIKATFIFDVLAAGQDVLMGTVASTTNPFATSSSFTIYKNEIDSSVSPSVVAFATPESGVTLVATNSMNLADTNHVQVTVIATKVYANASTADSYAMQVKNILGLTFMAAQSDWRTASI